MIAADDFLRQLRKLQDEKLSDLDNPGSFRCRDCQRCGSCMFCSSCEGCYKCTHCEACSDCTGCGHCARCSRCHGCAYCLDCEGCTSSAYLVQCNDCSDCTYCFGCVGLIRAEFHILNVPYPREQYFAITKQLTAELRLGRTP